MQRVRRRERERERQMRWGRMEEEIEGVRVLDRGWEREREG